MKKLNSTIFVKCFLVLALIAGSINLHSQSTYNFLVTQFTGTIGQGSRLQQLVRVQLNTGGRDVLDSMRFKLTGKDNIQSARLYYGGNAFSFWMSTYGTEVTTFSTDTLTFARNGSENFDLTGDVYFYLVLELKPTATVGQILDAECLKAYLNGFNKLTPAAGNPAGARKIVAPMTGTYTIKGAAGPNNFTKLSAAIDTLNRWGFTGGVTFILQDDSVFAENFSTKYIYQTGSLTNPIIIKRSGTGSAMPIVRPAGTNSGDDAGFTFWGSDFVTIDGIMIDGPTVTSPNKVDFGVRFRGAPYDGCQNITVQNCRIKLDSILDTRAIVTQRNGGFVMAATGTFDSVKILNNTVSYVRFGIVLNENNGFTQFPDKNGLVGGNIISNIGLQNESIGIFVRDQQDLKVFNNEIKDSKTGPNMQNWLRGMDITSCVGPVYVYGNKVHALINSGNANNSKVLGINVSAQTSYIYNNMVWDLASPASTINNGEVVRGITVSPTNNIGNAYIYNNSVFLNNVMTNFIQYTACMWVENTISTVEFKNNIFVAQATGPNAGRKNVSIWYNNGIALDRQLISSTDNNLYYAGIGSVNNLIIRNGGTEYQTLKAYQAATFGRDLHAITENAPFVSAYDLHINSSVATWIENGALPIGLVTTDIDGDPRNATTPDIGADEGVFLASLKDSLGPLIVYTLFADTTYSLAGRILSNVFITDTSKVDSLAGTKPRLYYKKSNNANAFPTPAQNATAAFNGWRYVEATNNSSPFNFPAMNYAVLNGGVPVVGTVIEYFVVAQDLHVAPNIAASPAQSIGVSTNIT